MIIRRNISLKNLNTFRLDYKADTVIKIKTEKEAKAIFRNELKWKQPLLILGEGSNILFTANHKGTIIRPEFRGINLLKHDGESALVSAGAGVRWDKFVEWCVEKRLYGVENLSGIPGTVGAVPVQNIGAYGVEAKDIILKVRTLSTEDGSIRIFRNEECRFGYRTSVFKKELKGKYLVTRVYFKLKSVDVFKLDYGSLKSEVEKFGKISLQNVRRAVLDIRSRKLPDPEVIGNAGSFFKNPVIDNTGAAKLKSRFPDIPLYDDPSGGVKIAAGWLIEQCGWKGEKEGEAGVHEKQALVIVNYGNATGKEIFDFSEKIRKSVKKKFGINPELEVEVIGIE